MLNDLQQKWCDEKPADYADLNALFLNCTLKKSPDLSHTEGLFQISKAIMEANGVTVEPVRPVDHQIAFGVYPDMPEQHWVHYIPIASTLICVAFLIVLLYRASRKNWPSHLNWWAIGVFFYGVGTALESSITLLGNSVALNRWWYWAGAILGGYPLATGTV